MASHALLRGGDTKAAATCACEAVAAARAVAVAGGAAGGAFAAEVALGAAAGGVAAGGAAAHGFRAAGEGVSLLVEALTARGCIALRDPKAVAEAVARAGAPGGSSAPGAPGASPLGARPALSGPEAAVRDQHEAVALCEQVSPGPGPHHHPLPSPSPSPLTTQP